VSASKPHPSSGHGSAGRAEAGFTLLEALIAIVILALSLSALLSLYSTGLRGVAAIDEHLRGRLLAQSLMAELTYDRALRPGRLQGRSEEFTWALSIAPFAEVEAARQQAGSNPWTLHQLTLTVSWPRGRRIELQTLRLLRTP
jgi:general secretion pathway protein I